MNFEELQDTWKEQEMPSRITVDAQLLLQEVRASRRLFSAAIFRRDALEVITAILLALGCIVLGVRQQSWPHFAGAAILMGVAGFMLGDRWYQHKNRAQVSDPLKNCIEASLREVNHQIWLLRNILWWYLLPITLGVLVVLARELLQLDPWSISWRFLLLAVVYGGIYWLNQHTVRTFFEPRKQELAQLLEGLDQN